MGYSYDEELDMYMDDDGHMLTEDMLPEDMQERLRMQRQADLEHEMALEEYETNKRYYEKIMSKWNNYLLFFTRFRSSRKVM